MSVRAVFAMTAVLAACGGGMKMNPAKARQAVYTASFPEILEAATEAVRAEYKKTVVNPQSQVIQTPWHQLPLTEHVSTREEDSRTEDSNPEDEGQYFQRRARRMESTDRTMRYFVRFDVLIQQVGGAPNASPAEWKIVVQGFASKWDGTARPEPLKGAETPYWLEKRIHKLEIAIYEKLQPMIKKAPGQGSRSSQGNELARERSGPAHSR